MRFRRHLAAGVLTAGFLGGMAAGAAEAGAVEPIVAADCKALVQGVAGQQVLLAAGAVLDPVLDALRPLDPLGLLAGPVRESWRSQTPLPLGTVPVGDLLISGTDIANATVDRLASIPVLAPVLQPLIANVSAAIGSTCGILVQQVEPEAPGTGEQQPPDSSAPGTTPPSSPSPGGTTPLTPSGGRLVTQDSADSGTTARFGFAEPLPFGPSLNFGAPGAFGVPQQGAPAATAAGGTADVVSTQRPTGTAEALPVIRDELSQPVLLATLALTLVAAQLVRTWVLRMRRS